MPGKSDDKPTVKRIAYFVSPHGFGHAARAAAVMQAISDVDASVEFEIFTTVPTWFFQDSLSVSFSCHALLTDIGLVQKTAFQADLNKTLRSLDNFLPFPAPQISEITAAVKKLHCAFIICDISPMGIAIAKASGIPSVLIENFTWDWIYRQYARTDKRFNVHIEYLRSWFEAVNFHIKTKPVCCHGSADLTTSPVSRKPRTSADRIRKWLGLPQTARMVLITTGGIKQSYGFLEKLAGLSDIYFVMPGAGPKMEIRDNSIILPHHSDFYHPDLVNASNAVVGKVGYSTLAEVYQAGIPFGYVVRSNFRESEPMAAFIAEEMQGIFLEESEFNSGRWTAKLQDLLDLNREKRIETNGAEQIGSFIRDRLLLNVGCMHK
jgi:UDP:flavonoid glycosyltransferase YjiC (YdhE family)